MKDNIETLEDLNEVIKELISTPEDNARFGYVAPPKEARRKKVPNKKDSKLIEKIWGNTNERKTHWLDDSSTGEKVRFTPKDTVVGSIIKKVAKMSHEECIERNKIFFDKCLKDGKFCFGF
jgi:hypothetical protein